MRRFILCCSLLVAAAIGIAMIPTSLTIEVQRQQPMFSAFEQSFYQAPTETLALEQTADAPVWLGLMVIAIVGAGSLMAKTKLQKTVVTRAITRYWRGLPSFAKTERCCTQIAL